MVTIKNVMSLVGFLVVLTLIYVVFFRTPSKPWEESGHFILAIRTVPSIRGDTLLNIGFDDFELYRKDGSTETVSVLTRRITLDPEDSSLTVLLDTLVPIGEYSGFAFVLKSPELRNEWQDDEPAFIVRLLEENVQLDVPYVIEKDVTSSVILSFETNTIIHKDGDENVLLPVIQLETRGNTQITGGENEPVAIVGGDILHSVTFGMDWDGRMLRNFRAKQKPAVTETPPALPETSTTTQETDVDADTTATSTATTSSATTTLN